MTKYRRRGLWSLAALAVGFTLVGGIAHAAITDSAGIIDACRNSTSGLLRVLDEGQACRGTETPLSWSSDLGVAQPTRFITRFGTTVEFVAPGADASPHALCAPGEQAVSGQVSGNRGLELVASLPVRSFPDLAPAGDGDVAIGWRYTFTNTGTETVSIHARVTCASNS